MTESASCRMRLRALGSLLLGNWALETSDRGGQDKSRKVRTVGCLRNSAKFSTSRTHCDQLAQLAFSDNALSSLCFCHLTGQT